MRRGGLIIGAILLVLFTILIFFGAYAPGTEEAARTNLVGLWRGVEDTKFTREFKSDGSVVDAYEGSTIDTKGRWVLFTKSMPPEGFTEALEDGLYLAIAAPESKALYFRITRIERGVLELVYLNRGGTLTFTKDSL
jgi:hypothetical protein